MNDYGKELELVVGPLKEYQKGGSESFAIKIKSDGTLNTLRIHGRISKSMVSIPNSSAISIWNLNETTRNNILQSQISMKLYAGYKGQEKELVFSGGVLSAVVERQGADIVTHLNGLDGQSNLLRSITSKTFGSQIKIKDAIKQIAASIDGVNLNEEDILVDGQIGYSGLSISGPTRNVLDRLGEQYGFNWFIEDGSFKAVGDKKTINTITVLDTNAALKKVSPLLSGPAQAQIGVDIRSKYVPGVSPASTVRVKSSINKFLNGDYKVHNMELDLDTKSEEWDMGLQCYTVGL